MTTLTLTCNRDTYIREGTANTNYGTENYLVLDVAFANDQRGLVGFDLSSVPGGATINSVTLRLYVQSVGATSDKTVTARRMLRADWVENEATWNVYKSGSNWTTAGCVGAADISSVSCGSVVVTTAGSLYDIDIDLDEFGLMLDNAQNTFRLVQSTANDIIISSRTNPNAGRGPYLVIDYALGDDPQAVWFG